VAWAIKIGRGTIGLEIILSRSRQSVKRIGKVRSVAVKGSYFGGVVISPPKAEEVMILSVKEGEMSYGETENVKRLSISQQKRNTEVQESTA